MANTNTARKTPRNAKKTAVAADAVVINMAGTATVVTSDDPLSDLLSLLEAGSAPTGVSAEPDEILVESGAAVGHDPIDDIAKLINAAPVQPVVVEAATHDDDDLAAALRSAESVDQAISAASTDTDEIGIVDAEAAEEQAADAAPGDTKPKKERVPRKHYTDKAERIADRLGASLGEYTVLTLADAEQVISDATLQLKMEETMAIIRKMNKKEQNRAGFFMEFISGKKAKLNEVLERTLRVTHADGFASMGKDGNLLANLLAKPYSSAAARAMGGNTVAMFADLKVLTKTAKGTYVANPDSLLLAKANALLGLGSKAE